MDIKKCTHCGGPCVLTEDAVRVSIGNRLKKSISIPSKFYKCKNCNATYPDTDPSAEIINGTNGWRMEDERPGKSRLKSNRDLIPQPQGNPLVKK